MSLQSEYSKALKTSDNTFSVAENTIEMAEPLGLEPQCMSRDTEILDYPIVLESDTHINTSFPGCFDAPALSTALTFLCLPVTWFGGCFALNERTHAAVLYFGKYKGTIQEPGLHFLPCCGLELRQMSTATRTMDMKDLKIVDLRGNPVIVSAVVTFEGTSARKARVDVRNPWPNTTWNEGALVTQGTYLQLQAQAVLKQVTSQFPYEAPPGVPLLQTEGKHITKMLIQSLQKRVAVTGAKIISFDLVDLSYAPEIAAHMLVRQQAAALVDARKLIVNAAVDMTHSAINQLDALGCPVDEPTKNSIITNLLTVICSNEAVKPVVNTSDGSSNKDKAPIVIERPYPVHPNELS